MGGYDTSKAIDKLLTELGKTTEGLSLISHQDLTRDLLNGITMNNDGKLIGGGLGADEEVVVLHEVVDKARLSGGEGAKEGNEGLLLHDGLTEPRGAKGIVLKLGLDGLDVITVGTEQLAQNTIDVTIPLIAVSELLWWGLVLKGRLMCTGGHIRLVCKSEGIINESLQIKNHKQK